VILKIVPEAGFGVYTGENRPIACEANGNRPMAEEKSWIRISDAAFGTMFIHVISKSFQEEASKKLIFIFLFKMAFKNISLLPLW
jgi:hypothetical protein